MNDAKEEVRARLNIEDVIGEYVQLKRAGRNLKGLSPFTDERTPSFMVRSRKQSLARFFFWKGVAIFFTFCDDGGRNGFSSIAGAFRLGKRASI